MRKPLIEDGFNRGDCKLTFGDNVRVRITPETEAAGMSGLAGQVMGETTPSVTQVAVIGVPKHDYAIMVSIPNRRDAFLFDPDLLEFVDRGPGTTISIGHGTFERQSDGDWKRLGLVDRIKTWVQTKLR